MHRPIKLAVRYCSALLGLVLAQILSWLGLSGCASQNDFPDDKSDHHRLCPDVSTKLWLPGSDRMQVAMNAYYLQEEATRALRKGETSAAIVDEVMQKAAMLSVTILRTNAHNDASSKVGDSAMQVAKLQFDEVALRGFDLVLHQAAQHNIRLILPLANYWDAYGGTRQYVHWAGLKNPKQGDSRFFTEVQVIDHFKAYISYLLNRRNHIDDIRIGDHPAVLAWELINEARGEGGPGLDKQGEQMRAWVDVIAKHIKSETSTHWVMTGEEGIETNFAHYDEDFWRRNVDAGWLFQGRTSFAKNLASPWIDAGSVHLYPDGWRFNPKMAAAAGSAWIAEHAAVARDLGKALIVGEFGLRNRDSAFVDLQARREVYRQWFECARRSGVAVIAPWLFAHDSRPDDWDIYSFYFKQGSCSTDAHNRYADIIHEAATGNTDAHELCL